MMGMGLSAVGGSKFGGRGREGVAGCVEERISSIIGDRFRFETGHFVCSGVNSYR
jgi:hypothetical protein